MEQMNSENLSTDGMFKEIKDKCKSRSKVNIYIGLALVFVLLLSMIAGLIYHHGIPHLNHPQIVSIIFLAIIACAICWLVLNNYRFLRNTDSLATPEQLLNAYEKKLKGDRILYFASIISLLVGQIDSSIYYSHDDVVFSAITVACMIGVIAFFAIYWYQGLKDETFKFYRRDVEILEQLQELIDMK